MNRYYSPEDPVDLPEGNNVRIIETVKNPGFHLEPRILVSVLYIPIHNQRLLFSPDIVHSLPSSSYVAGWHHMQAVHLLPYRFES